MSDKLHWANPVLAANDKKDERTREKRSSVNYDFWKLIMLAYKTFMYHQITLVSKLSPDKRAWYSDKPGIHAWKAQKEMIYGNGNNRGYGFGRNASASMSINTFVS